VDRSGKKRWSNKIDDETYRDFEGFDLSSCHKSVNLALMSGLMEDHTLEHEDLYAKFINGRIHKHNLFDPPTELSGGITLMGTIINICNSKNMLTKILFMQEQNSTPNTTRWS